jgi:hypothetical protein
MSAETVSSINTVEIYIPLRNEGTEVLRPTTGLVLGSDVVQVLATSDYWSNHSELTGCRSPSASEGQHPRWRSGSDNLSNQV